jgi:type I restriction enzyme S subunit
VSEWPTVRLKDVLTSDRRPVTPVANKNYVEIGVRSFGRGIFKKPAVTGLDLGTKRVFEIVPDRLVFNIVFAWEGAVARTRESEQGTIASHRFPNFECDVEIADLDFLTYLFRSEAGLQLMRLASPGSAGRNRTLSLDALLNTSISLPVLSEQQRLTRWLSIVEDGVTRLDSAIAPGDRLENLFREAVLRTTVAESWSAPLHELLIERDVDVDLKPSSTFSPAGVYSFGRGLFRRPAITGIDTSYRTMTTIHAGDFIYSKLMAWEGAVAVASEQHEGLLATPEFPVFALDRDRLNAEYFGALIRTESFGSELRRLSTGTNARRRRVHPSTMMGVEIPLPPMNVQEHVAEIAVRLKQREGGRKLAQSRISAILPAALNQVFGSLN